TYDTADGVDVVASLIDKNLLWRDEQVDGEPRLRMLETIRMYGQAQLWGSGVADDIRARHAEYFVNLAERAEPELVGPDQHDWFARLQRERANLLAVERWALSRDKADIMLRMAAAVWPVWLARADAIDARERLRAVMRLAANAPVSPTLARALHAAGVLAE